MIVKSELKGAGGAGTGGASGAGGGVGGQKTTAKLMMDAIEPTRPRSQTIGCLCRRSVRLVVWRGDLVMCFSRVSEEKVSTSPSGKAKPCDRQFALKRSAPSRDQFWAREGCLGGLGGFSINHERVSAWIIPANSAAETIATASLIINREALRPLLAARRSTRSLMRALASYGLQRRYLASAQELRSCRAIRWSAGCM